MEYYFYFSQEDAEQFGTSVAFFTDGKKLLYTGSAQQPQDYAWADKELVGQYSFDLIEKVKTFAPGKFSHKDDLAKPVTPQCAEHVAQVLQKMRPTPSNSHAVQLGQ